MINILQKIMMSKECIVLPPSGFPRLKSGFSLPIDLHQFYSQCGGVVFFPDSEYSMEIVKPEDFKLSNFEILGDDYLDSIPENDISNDWYIVAQSGIEQRVSIDLNLKRLGKCYDSFWDIHASPGESPVLAISFTDLLSRCFSAQGQYWYWLAGDFISLGDAYD